MRYKITAPVPHVISTVAGVAFNDSVGYTDSDPAVAYFRRHGYQVEEVEESPEPVIASAEQPPTVIEAPTRGATKDSWVTYVTSEAAGDKRLTLDEATALKRDELAERVLGPKED